MTTATLTVQEQKLAVLEYRDGADAVILQAILPIGPAPERVLVKQLDEGLPMKPGVYHFVGEKNGRLVYVRDTRPWRDDEP